MPQDSTADVHGRLTSQTAIQMFHIPVETPTLTYNLVFTTRTDVKDHEPLKGNDGDIRDCFDCEERSITLSSGLVKRFRTCGWEKWLATEVDENDRVLKAKPYLEVYCQFAVRRDNRSIDIGARVMEPESVMHSGTSVLYTATSLADQFSHQRPRAKSFRF